LQILAFLVLNLLNSCDHMPSNQHVATAKLPPVAVLSSPLIAQIDSKKR
jgi:hypothetical protein